MTVWDVTAGAQQGTENGEWRHYGGDAGSTRYAPFDQINRDNFGDLEIAWRWKSDNFGDRPEFNSRVTPIVVGDVMYATAGYRRAAVAIDATTGETLWMYRMDEGARTASAPRLNSGRGLSYWTDGARERILLITPAYHLVSLDARTGRPDPDFGIDGVVDLRHDLDAEVDPLTGEIGSSSPAMVVGDVAVIGAAMVAGTAPATKENIPGHVRGYDIRTGERLWIFHTIPQPGEYGHDTWENDSWAYTGNTAVWPPMSADLELGYVYLPVEDATGDYYCGHRPGNNLFSSSLVCLDARTGERVWHFQLIHHDIWDWDVPAPPILIDLEVDGRPVKAVAQVTKQAFTYVFDRVTGEPVWPIEERPVPASDTPGEWTSPTQPFPTKPPPFDRQGMTEDDLIDFTPEIKAAALEIASQLRLGPMFTPPSVADPDGGTQGTLVLPNAMGGANWPGASVDAENGILYVTSVTNPSIHGLAPDPDRSNMDYVGGRGLRLGARSPLQGLPIVKPPWGRVTAIDLNKGEILWQVPNGETPDYVKEHPMLQGVDIPPTGQMDRGGTFVTRTLMFAGEGGGMFAARGSGGHLLRAYDKMTGDVVGALELPANQTGVPMTYMVDGRQYIAVVVGAQEHPAEIIALALPD